MFKNKIEKHEWLCKLFKRQKLSLNSELRIIYVNGLKPSFYHDDNNYPPLKYPNNTIKTSKYTLFNFIFKNLYAQFRRIANFYFLLTIIMRFLLLNSAINPYASMIPLVIVILATMLKQGYEDLLRHRLDNRENNKKINVLRDGYFQQIECKHIKCGDILQVYENSMIPCDMVVLHSSNMDKVCHVTTANLDGESNVKVKQQCFEDIELSSEEDLRNLRGVVVCDKPNAKMYEFKGKFVTETKEYPLSPQHLLLRGSCLKMTTFIYACAIYTGQDTKMILNYKLKPNKISCVERQLNRSMIIFFIILANLTFLSFGLALYRMNNYWHLSWYLTGKLKQRHDPIVNINVLFDSLSLYTPLIPLSMYVSIEIVRFVGKRFFEWDEEMCDDDTQMSAIVNNTDLNENLGQIEYLFCDKTGTLTVNEMIFKQCFIDGYLYKEINGSLTCVNYSRATPNYLDPLMSRFFEVLCLCHSIQVNTLNREYQASSPDEFAFIKFCEKIGVIYTGEHKQDQRLVRSFEYKSETKKYEVLHLLDFDSNRKRMSIIVRCMATSTILVLCKGAENSIFEKTISANIAQVNAQIDEFARVGWRTLAIAYRVLSETQLDYFNQILDNAYKDVNAREEKLAQAFEEIESNLILIGATGIEDRLQDDCAHTIEAIRMAGIKVWILTGDKTETAVNISKACRHFSPTMTINYLTEVHSSEIDIKLEQLSAHMTRNDAQCLVVDGKSLTFIYEKQLTTNFLNVCLKCKAVVCCRMSPIQKSQIVRLVKRSAQRPLTAAIGDGANDVSMIQEANVGIGLFGKEGRNAARAADFSIAKFKHLKRVILFHGLLYYTRISILVQYFFYKNIAFVLCQFYYSFFHSFSGQNLYHTIVMNLYNISLSSVPICIYGLFEQRFSLSNIEHSAKIYKSLVKNQDLTMLMFSKWILFGLWHSIVAYFTSHYFFLYGELNANGHISGQTSFALLVTIIVVCIVHVKLLIEWRYWSFMFLLAFCISFLLCFSTLIAPSSGLIPSFLVFVTEDQSYYWVSYSLLSNISVWLCILLATVTAILPDIMYKVFEAMSQMMMQVNEPDQVRSKMFEQETKF